MTLTGYLDRLSAVAGSSVSCMVSSTAELVELDVVRLLHGDTNPAGPGSRMQDVPEIPARVVEGGLQHTHLGSCVVVSSLPSSPIRGTRLKVLFQPTLPRAGHEQAIVSLLRSDGVDRIVLGLSSSGNLTVRSGARELLGELAVTWERDMWYRAVLSLYSGGTLSLSCETVDQRHASSGSRLDTSGVIRSEGSFDEAVFGASSCRRVGEQWQPVECFNGKIEHPLLTKLGLDDEVAELIGDWRFELEQSGSRCVDASGHNRHGTVVNSPMRGATGSQWQGREVDFTKDPRTYAAIHFHEDDLDDAGWPARASIDLPADLSSGVYAVRLRAGEHTDLIPLVVTPGPAIQQARIAVLLPTFTYVAYANERMLDRLDFEGDQQTDHPITPGAHDQLLAEHPEWGLSLYDLHSDGSTCVHSTHLRPIPNLRPDYRAWLQNAPRHLGADLYLIDWLTEKGRPFDVFTDHDLAEVGPSLLAPYDVVITGSHPEYVSERILDALESHRDRGGSLLYLGGNGFYWVTSQDETRPHLVEVRRGAAGTRPSEGAPGEGVHSTTGESGGLWRSRGRWPNRLTGVGMTAQGWDQKAPGYERMPASRRPEVAYVFAGIADDEIIGDFGLIMNGSSGDELDRFDVDRGSPPETLVLARSTGHSDYYQLAGEDVLATRPGLGGTECPDVRSDMTLLQTPAGGLIFSVGSICFTGSLSHNGYQNNVSTIIGNVLDEIDRRSQQAALPIYRREL